MRVVTVMKLRVVEVVVVMVVTSSMWFQELE